MTIHTQIFDKILKSIQPSKTHIDIYLKIRLATNDFYRRIDKTSFLHIKMTKKKQVRGKEMTNLTQLHEMTNISFSSVLIVQDLEPYGDFIRQQERPFIPIED